MQLRQSHFFNARVYATGNRAPPPMRGRTRVSSPRSAAHQRRLKRIPPASIRVQPEEQARLHERAHRSEKARARGGPAGEVARAMG